MKAPIRGAKPYVWELKTIGGVTVETRTSDKDEEVFNSDMNDYSYKVTDANGQVIYKTVDSITTFIMNKKWKIYSSTYGNPAELVQHIQNTKNLSNGAFNVAGVPFTTWEYFRTQEQWDSPVWQRKFDHTIDKGENPDPNSFECTYDAIIYKAYRTGTSISNKMGLKVGINFGRMGVYNPSVDGYQYATKDQGYSFTYPYNDIQRRPDGRLHNECLYYGFPYTVSYASDDGLTYYKEMCARFCYRYSQAINDGTIHGINFWFDESGEAQYPFHYINADGSDAGRGLGDFSDPMRRKFAEFCKANFTTATDQSTARFNQKYGTNYNAFTIDNFNRDQLSFAAPTELRKLFYWFQMEMLSQFEIAIQEYAYQKAGITRSKLWIMDVGAIWDGLLTYRKTLNVNRRLGKSNRWIGVKGNNSIDEIDFAMDQILSGAKFAGAIPIYEPSPSFAEFTVQALTNAVNALKPKGLHLSAFIPADAYNFWTQVANNTNLINYTDTFKIDDLQSSGNPITTYVNFKDCVFDEFTDGTPTAKLKAAFTQARNANPGKSINIVVDDSDIIADLKATTGVSRVPLRTAIIGNSITLHPYAPELNWYWNDRGMAATSPDKDYVHLVRARVKAVNPSASVEIRSNGALFEGFYHDNTQWRYSDLIADLQAYNPELIILRIGENVNDAEVYNRNFKGALGQWIDSARSVNAGVKIAISTSTWNNLNYDTIVRQVVAEKNTAQSPLVVLDYTYISDTFRSNKFNSPYFAFQQQFDLEPGQNAPTNEGVLQHLGDFGMQSAANKIWDSVITPLYNS